MHSGAVQRSLTLLQTAALHHTSPTVAVMEEGAARSEREAEAFKEEVEAQKASGERRWECLAPAVSAPAVSAKSLCSLTTRGWSRVAEAERGRDDALKYLAKVRHDTIKRADCC